MLITTPRLKLRDLSGEDAEALNGVFGDPDVMQYGDGVQTPEWVEDWTSRMVTNRARWGYAPGMVVERWSDVPIGYCGLFHRTGVNGRAEHELGYRLVKAAWGNGFATEAANAVLEHAFETLGLFRIVALIDPSNAASLRVAEKIGMRYEADVMMPGYTYPDKVYVIER